MKINKLGLLFLVLFVSFSCKKEHQEKINHPAKSTKNATLYSLDTSSSNINYAIYTLNKTKEKENAYFGTIPFKASTFKIKRKTSEALFTADLSLLKLQTTENENLKTLGLEDLKSNAFFNTLTYPVATFNFVKIKALPSTVPSPFNTKITATFTIKNSIKEYHFKANSIRTDSTYSIFTDDIYLNKNDFDLNLNNIILKDQIKFQFVIIGKKIDQ